jgi:hypothetical protein
MRDRHELGKNLLSNIQLRQRILQELLDKLNGHWVREDGIYRYYHHSFKVYGLQGFTEEVVAQMRLVHPIGSANWPEYGWPKENRKRHEFNPMFEDIIAAGTGKVFENDHNKEWEKHTLPIVTAFMHAHHVLEMMVKYGEELDESPQMLPSGWATVLYMFGIR